MNMKERIIQTKCENDPVFRERYLRKQVKPLAVILDLLRRGENDLMAHEAARLAIIESVDLLLLHPELSHHVMRVIMEAHKLAREPAPKASEPLSVAEAEQQIDDEF